jgi:HTH-type transcriptional repressor of NAD biosynthesis genes
MTRGMVLGKFMPPHLGHVYLVDFARAWVDDLTVVVGTLAREPIPGELRARWMRELVAGDGARVVHLTDENPQEPHEHPAFWDIWRESLLRVLPHPVDYVFASETYGARLARELSAEWIPVDVARATVPVIASAIRADPMANWRFIPRCVRPYFLRRVCIVGPESSGKTTLAEGLARHFHTTWVPEYARTLLEPRERDTGGTAPIAREDIVRIACGQMASETALAPNAERILFADTDATTTLLWSELLFGGHDDDLEVLASEHTHDLYLLCAPDLAYVPDAVRYAERDREGFFVRLEGELSRRNRKHVVIRGSGEARLRAAVTAIEAIWPVFC